MLSGRDDNNTHCYYFIDKDQSHIVNTNREINEKKNLYDVEVLMVHLDYQVIEDEHHEVYDHDAKILEVRSLVTDSATATTFFLDTLWKHKDVKSIKKIYVYKNDVFDTVENLILYLVDQK